MISFSLSTGQLLVAAGTVQARIRDWNGWTVAVKGIVMNRPKRTDRVTRARRAIKITNTIVVVVLIAGTALQSYLRTPYYTAAATIAMGIWTAVWMGTAVWSGALYRGTRYPTLYRAKEPDRFRVQVGSGAIIAAGLLAYGLHDALTR